MWGLRESESWSQINSNMMIWDGAEITVDESLRSLEHACLRADVRENMCWSFWRVKKKDPVLDME